MICENRKKIARNFYINFKKILDNAKTPPIAAVLCKRICNQLHFTD